MFAQEFFIQEDFAYHEAISSWKEQKMRNGVTT
jgi:hypothetical protein